MSWKVKAADVKQSYNVSVKCSRKSATCCRLSKLTHNSDQGLRLI